MKYIDDEINDLPYDLALLNDSRTYCLYYFSLIRSKHYLIFSFCYSRNYNSRIVKIDLFFLIFALNYTVNGFFYSDATMHNIYVKKGAFDLEYQLQKIFYSSLITIFLGITIMKKLALSNDAIINYKKNKEEKDINEREKKLETKLKIKFIFYFILSFILLLFFWYYISMFGAIYSNTQHLLLKDTLLSFGFSLIYPFIIFLIPGFFRIPALADSQKNKECMYKFSKFFHFF